MVSLDPPHPTPVLWGLQRLYIALSSITRKVTEAGFERRSICTDSKGGLSPPPQSHAAVAPWDRAPGSALTAASALSDGLLGKRTPLPHTGARGVSVPEGSGTGAHICPPKKALLGRRGREEDGLTLADGSVSSLSKHHLHT